MITTKLHPALNTPIDNDVDGIQVDHNKLLADLVELNCPLITIAKDHKLRLDQLIAWAAQPAVRSLLDAADELAHRIAAHKAAQGATAAVQTLLGQAIGLCETIREQEIAGRGARAILRLASRPNPKRNPKPDPNPKRKRQPAKHSSRLNSLLNNTGSDHPAAQPPTLRFPVYPFRPEPNPTDFTRPNNPISPIGPMSPIEPAHPRSPIEPTSPISPIRPMSPISPIPPPPNHQSSNGNPHPP